MTMHGTARRTLAVAVIAAAPFAVACGRKQSVASKSAAEYDEAQRKGVAPGGGGHGEHGVAPGAASPAPEEAHAGHGPGAAEPREGMAHAGHSGMAGMDHSRMADVDHGRAPGHGRTNTKGVAGHEAHAPAASGQAGHGAHATPVTGGQAGHGAHVPSATGAQPGHGGHMPTTGATSTGHGDHAGMAHGAGTPLPPPSPEPPSATAHPGQPAATLRSDAIDAPAPTSVGDAARSAEMASGRHAMQHGTYTQTDAGRDSVVAPRPSPSPHHEEDHP